MPTRTMRGETLIDCAAATLALLVACGGPTNGSGAPPLGKAPSPSPGAPPGVPGGPVADAPRPDAKPALRFVGRFDTRAAEGPTCGWPGCRILARFDGTAVSVRLDEHPGSDGPTEWDVAIDGAWRAEPLVLEPGPHDYDLAKGLPPGAHTVELYKRSESQAGVTELAGFDLHGGALLAPPPAPGRTLEIIGDSDVAGYGYRGALDHSDCGGQAWLAKYQDFRAAWGARLGEALGADVSGVVFSGKGLYYNAWRPDTETMGVLYPRANPEDATSTMDLSTLPADVVVVALGGNDYDPGEPTDTGPAPLDAFTDKARELAARIRAAHPRAHLFMMVYAALTDDYPAGANRRSSVRTAFATVVRERRAAGDARVYLAEPPQATPDELDACSGHGGPAYHARVAAFMATEIAAKTGWR